jgi:PAS domain-containing protein
MPNKPTKREADGFESAEIWDEHTYRQLRDELQVNREELAAQHAQLVESRREVELAHDEYIELFDGGPIACFILDGSGVIQRSNLAGADLVGSEPMISARVPARLRRRGDRRIWLEHMRPVAAPTRRCRASSRFEPGAVRRSSSSSRAAPSARGATDATATTRAPSTCGTGSGASWNGGVSARSGGGSSRTAPWRGRRASPRTASSPS